MTTQIPQTREDAINALVESDVAQWGESERDSSRRMHADLSYGLALNELASRADLTGTPNKALRAAAKAALTKSDKSELRKAL